MYQDERMASSAPLTPNEAVLWHALVRLMISLPRGLDADLTHETGLSLAEYGVLSTLSEAPEQQLRMSDLAAAVNLSASRITRLVADLQLRGLVKRERSPDDARAGLATVTQDGLRRLEAVYPIHLASVRRRVFDHLDSATVSALGEALQAIVPR
jgi:DNA-binding MarR family transcriptional regulator